MCLGEEHARSREWSARIVSFSLWESSALVCPFSRENRGNHLPPAAQVQPMLRQRGDWGRGDCRWSSLTSLWEELISRARQRLTRVNCWKKMYCLLHLLIQQEVLCWLMVVWWRRREEKSWAFSDCLPRVCRAAGGYEVCASARLNLQWRHEKGEWLVVDLRSDLSLA